MARVCLGYPLKLKLCHIFVAIVTRKFIIYIILMSYLDWPGIGHLIAIVTQARHFYVTICTPGIPLYDEIDRDCSVKHKLSKWDLLQKTFFSDVFNTLFYGDRDGLWPNLAHALILTTSSLVLLSVIFVDLYRVTAFEWNQNFLSMNKK